MSTTDPGDHDRPDYPQSAESAESGQSAPPVAGMPPLGSLWRRVVARLIDGAIVLVTSGVILVVGGWAGSIRSGGAGSFWAGVLGSVLYWVYDALLMICWRGQTVGKRLLQIRVAMLADGRVPQPGPAWGRAAVYALPGMISCLGQLFGLVNVLWCTWDRPFRQCLHDKAVKTVVVSTA